MHSHWLNERQIARQTGKVILMVWMSCLSCLVLLHLQTWLVTFRHLGWGITWACALLAYAYLALRTGFDLVIFFWFSAAISEEDWIARLQRFDHWLHQRRSPDVIPHRTMRDRQRGVYRLLAAQIAMAIALMLLVAAFPKEF